MGPGSDLHSLREDHFPRDHVFTDAADIVPEKDWGFYGNGISLRIGDILHHDHGIGPRGHDVTGIDGKGILSHGKMFGPLRSGSEGFGRQHRKPIHGRLMHG